MKFIGGGRALGAGGKPKAGNTIHKEANSSAMSSCSRAQKLPQSTRQDETVVSSSLTPQAALLVPISGPIDPVVDRRDFTGSAFMLSYKMDFSFCAWKPGFVKSSHI